MDGQAIALAFASQSGPDCIKDVVSKYGLRLKVYQIIKKEIEAIEAKKLVSLIREMEVHVAL